MDDSQSTTVEMSSYEPTQDVSSLVTHQICGLFMPLDVLAKDKEALGEHLSPFIKYEGDGYHWPDLFTEIDEMIEPNVLIYAIAELRKIAREQHIPLGDTVLDLPVSHSEIMQVVETNRKLLETTRFGQEFYVQILKAVDERSMTRFTDREGQPVPEKELTEIKLSPETIVAFDDEYADKELVYMIEVNHRRKRVTVTFRGSVTETGEYEEEVTSCGSMARFVYSTRQIAHGQLSTRFPLSLSLEQTGPPITKFT